MIGSLERRPLGFTAVGVFLLFGSAVSIPLADSISRLLRGELDPKVANSTFYCGLWSKGQVKE